MVLSSENVRELVDETIAESRITAEELGYKCSRWEKYLKELPQIRNSIEKHSKPEIRLIDLDFDAGRFLQNIRVMLQEVMEQKDSSQDSKYSAQKKDVMSLNNYITDMHNWIAEYGDQLDRAIESLNNELAFLEEFCSCNGISLD